MVRGPLVALALSLALPACGSSEAPSGSGGAAGAAGAAGSAGSAGASSAIDPALFDCTATSVPERTSPVPASCATDRSCTTRMVTGHRGAGGEIGVIAPENTLAAVRAAIALGIEFIETDPRPTADGVLVNLHDDDVDRTTDGTGLAAELTLAQIQALNIEAADYPGDFSCERVPTIEQVLALAKGKIVVLLDANKTDRVDLLVAAVHATDTLDWAIFDTDSPEKIQEALLLEPALHTMIRVSDQAEFDAELQTFAAHPPVIVELNEGASPASLGPAVHAAGHRVFTDAFGTDVAAGLADDPSLYGPIFESGADILQTDRPDLVLEYLAR
jgi:glycerophosphoryl diester phosphodiesterase